MENTKTFKPVLCIFYFSLYLQFAQIIVVVEFKESALNEIYFFPDRFSKHKTDSKTATTATKKLLGKLTRSQSLAINFSALLIR